MRVVRRSTKRRHARNAARHAAQTHVAGIGQGKVGQLRVHHVRTVIAQVGKKAAIVSGRCGDKLSVTILAGEPVVV